MADFGAVLGDVGSAAGSLFSALGAGATAHGAEQAASLYTQASQYADQNVQYAITNEQIQQMLSARAFGKAEGKARAAAGASGLDLLNSPDVIDALRETRQQQQIQSEIIGIQGGINENAYREQSFALQGQAASSIATAEAARSSETGSLLGGLFGIGKALFSFF